MRMQTTVVMKAMRRLVHSTRMKVVLNWARAGRAVALVPRSAVGQLGFSDLRLLTVSDHALPVPALTIVAQKRKYRSQIVNRFLDLLAEQEGFAYREPVLEESHKKESL